MGDYDKFRPPPRQPHRQIDFDDDIPAPKSTFNYKAKYQFFYFYVGVEQFYAIRKYNSIKRV